MKKAKFNLEFDFSMMENSALDVEQDFNNLLDIILTRLNRKGTYVLSCELVDDETIQKLNKKFRDIDKPTDVLSFQYTSKEDFDLDLGIYDLGEIYIDTRICALQAPEFNLTVEEEAIYLFIHGVLHLFGYDHVHNDEEKEVMFSLQNDIFSKYMQSKKGA